MSKQCKIFELKYEPFNYVTLCEKHAQTYIGLEKELLDIQQLFNNKWLGYKYGKVCQECERESQKQEFEEENGIVCFD